MRQGNRNCFKYLKTITQWLPIAQLLYPTKGWFMSANEQALFQN